MHNLKLLWAQIKLLCGIQVPPAIFNAYTRSSQNYSSLPTLAIIGAYWYDFLYYLYIHIESRMYNNSITEMYKYTSPVWGTLFMIFERRRESARSMKFLAWPIPDTLSVYHPYIPTQFKYSIFNFLPYASNIVLYKYLPSRNNWYTIYINRIIFIINCFIFFIATSFINI